MFVKRGGGFEEMQYPDEEGGLASRCPVGRRGLEEQSADLEELRGPQRGLQEIELLGKEPEICPLWVLAM